MKKKVVVIEDEKNIAFAEQLILEDHFEVHLAHTGEDGLNKVKEIKPDVVVLDLMLPSMSGHEVCKAIRLDKGLASTKVVMVTAKNQEEDEKEGMDLGADDYIMKPFEPVELVHVINQVLEH